MSMERNKTAENSKVFENKKIFIKPDHIVNKEKQLSDSLTKTEDFQENKYEQQSIYNDEDGKTLEELICISEVNGPKFKQSHILDNYCVPIDYKFVGRSVDGQLKYLNLFIDAIIETSIQFNRKLWSMFDVKKTIADECYILQDVVEQVNLSQIYSDFILSLINIQKRFDYTEETLSKVTFIENVKVFRLLESYFNDLRMLSEFRTRNFRLKTNNEFNFGKHRFLYDEETSELLFKSYIIDHIDNLYVELLHYDTTPIEDVRLDNQKLFLMEKIYKIERNILKDHLLHQICIENSKNPVKRSLKVDFNKFEKLETIDEDLTLEDSEAYKSEVYDDDFIYYEGNVDDTPEYAKDGMQIYHEAGKMKMIDNKHTIGHSQSFMEQYSILIVCICSLTCLMFLFLLISKTVKRYFKNKRRRSFQLGW